MKPLRARYNKITQMADRLLREHSIITPPVPVDKIAKNLGVKLRYGRLGEVSGLLVRTNESATIGVNVTQMRVRQRFTIAHELGHLLLHQGIWSHKDEGFLVNFRSAKSSEATNVEEIEANFFAASILIPKQFLDQDNAIRALDSDTAVRDLARKYNVSRHAMSLRLANVYGAHRPF
jgi:Zn-dependent peptidase ImmA (M78 family)